MSASCRAVTRLLESYLDGELEPSQMLEVETHLLDCRTCTERMMLDRAIRASVRRRQAALTASESLHERVKASMIADKNRPSFASVGTPRTPHRWQMAALSAAALFTVLPFSSSTQVQRMVSRSTENRDVQTATAAIGLDALVDQFVDWHSRPLPPEITNVNDMPAFEPYVGVPVKPPPLQPFGAHLLGGRILPVHDQRVAAMLQYMMQNGHRISVYVYDPRRVVASPSHLHPWGASSSSEPPVYVGNVRGYTVAAAQRQGVGYAVASDLDDDENAELALAAAP